MKEYKGLLDYKSMPKDVKQGYASWANQKSKCYNPKNPDFKYYGAKGIKVEYSSREFVAWWLLNLEKKKWKAPTVGRINHDGNYCFTNIEMQEHLENVRERVRRCGLPIGHKPKPVKAFLNGKFFKKFPSISEAARSLNKPVSTVTRICRGINGLKKTREGFRFEMEL